MSRYELFGEKAVKAEQEIIHLKSVTYPIGFYFITQWLFVFSFKVYPLVKGVRVLSFNRPLIGGAAFFSAGDDRTNGHERLCVKSAGCFPAYPHQAKPR